MVGSFDTNRRAHFGPAHPVATVAAWHCAAHLGLQRRRGLGGVACGACWELAIRDDERVAVECDLPREVAPDVFYIDEIAVERACRGDVVKLTPAEEAEVTRRLNATGRTAARPPLLPTAHAVGRGLGDGKGFGPEAA